MIRGIAALLAAVFFALYAFTSARDLTLVDSAELSLACATGSVPHPPGFPLFFLVGRAACLVSPFTAIRTTTLLSVLWTALSVALAFLLVERMIATLAALAGPRTRGASDPRGRIAAAIVAACAWGTSRNPWTWAGVTEVYALNVMLLAGAWAAAWAGAAALASKSGSGRGAFTASAVFAALGLANHHATALVAWVPLLPLVLLAAPSLFRRRWFLAALAGSVLGSLALYLVLLAAGRAERGLDWGGIRDLPLLVRHIEGKQYHVQFGGDAEGARYVARDFAKSLLLDPGIPVAILALAGVPLALAALRSSRAARLALAFLGAALLANLALSIGYVVGPEDRVAYDLPAHLAWCAAAGLGAWGVSMRASRGGAASGRFRVAAAVLAAVVPGWNVARNFAICDFRTERAARTFVEETFRDVPEGAVVLLAEWNLGAPYFYMHEIEGFRPDLRVVDILMMRRFWYLGTLERTMPELAAASRPEFDAFRDQVTRFDLGRPFDTVLIQKNYEDLLRKWADVGRRGGGGAYLDWATAMRPDETPWVQRMSTVPDGLLIRIEDAQGPGASGPFAAEQRPLPAMDAENLRFLRAKLPTSAAQLDLTAIVPRHVQYWKVYSAYMRAAEGSLLYALLQGRPQEARELHARYAAWFPDADLIAQSALRRAGGASPPAASSPPAPSLPGARPEPPSLD